jgi:hypothetical protein
VDLETGEVTAHELRRAAPGCKAFGYQIAISRAGAFSKAVALFCGVSEHPDPAAQRVQEALTRALAACPTERTRRGVAELHYVLAAELRSVKGGYRCQGSDVYFGRQHELLGGRDEKGRPLRRYIRKGEQGGLAERFKRCVKTIERWWSILVDAGVWKSWTPPRDAPGAMLNASGSQVYAQRCLVGGTPRAAIAQLPHRRDKRAAPPGHRGPMLADEYRSARAFIDGLERWVY